MAGTNEQSKDTSTKRMGILDQTETQYTPVSIVPGKACSSCLWYRNNYCHIVANYPEDIVPNGYCNRHEVFTPPPPQDMSPIPVMIVEPSIDEMDSAEMALPTTRRGLKELVTNWLKPTQATPTEKTVNQPFTAFKGNDGEWYWLARHTGKWVDREDEILADHAHEEYVTRVQKGLVPMPELWTWHKKGTMHGVADIVWKSGGFLLALGHFVGTKEQVKRAVEYYQKHGDKIKLSHMFKYPKNGKRGKVYHAYNTVEITTLPIGAEAFPYTSYEVDNMLSKEQLEMIRGIGGDDMVARAQAADTKALTETTKLDGAGVASKNHDNFEGSSIPQDDELKALGTVQKDFDSRLKKVEALPELLTTLDSTLKSLSSQLATLQTTSNDALAKANANEQKLLEFQAVAPPASKSEDTLLNEREKSLMEQMATQAKSEDGGQSLIESFFKPGAPVVTVPQ